LWTFRGLSRKRRGEGGCKPSERAAEDRKITYGLPRQEDGGYVE
jgi:hypothetical protein